MISERNYRFPQKITYSKADIKQFLELKEITPEQSKLQRAYRSRIHLLIERRYDEREIHRINASRAYSILSNPQLQKTLQQKGKVTLRKDTFYTIQRAAEEGDLLGLEEILEANKGSVSINGQDSLGHTALYVAIRAGRFDIASWLLNSGADTDIQQSTQSTALHAACFYGHPEGVKLLLDAGVNVVIKNKFDKIASEEIWAKDEEEEDLIYSYFNQLYNTIWGKVASLNLSPNSYGEEFKELLNNDGLIDMPQYCKRTLLMVTCKQGKYDLALWLIQHNANLEIQDKFQNTALHLASFHGHSKIVELLLHSWSDPTALNKWSKTPEQEAKDVATKKVFEMEKQNPWERVFTTDGEKVILGDVRWFRFYGGSYSVDDKDVHQRTLLYIAAKVGHLELVKLLVSKKAQIDAVQIEGSTPLHTASYYGHVAIVQYLLEQGSNPFQKNGRNYSAIEEVDHAINSAQLKPIYEKYTTIESVPKSEYKLSLYNMDEYDEMMKMRENYLPFSISITTDMTFEQLIKRYINAEFDLQSHMRSENPMLKSLPYSFRIGRNLIKAQAHLPVLQAITISRNSLSRFMEFPVALQYRRVPFSESFEQNKIQNHVAKFKALITEPITSQKYTISKQTTIRFQTYPVTITFPEGKYENVSFIITEYRAPDEYPTFHIKEATGKLSKSCLPFVELDSQDKVWKLYQYHNSSASWFGVSSESGREKLPFMDGIFSIVWKVQICRGPNISLDLFRDLYDKIDYIDEKNHKIIIVSFKLPETVIANLNNYDRSYHGTSITAIESIVTDGLVKAGTLTALGQKIEPPPEHIQRNNANYPQGFAEAVFTSPSFYYALSEIYAREFNLTIPNTNLNVGYAPVLECLVHKNGYKKEKKTTLDYVARKFDPLLPFSYIPRLPKDEDDNELEWRVENPDNVVVKALYLVDAFRAWQ